MQRPNISKSKVMEPASREAGMTVHGIGRGLVDGGVAVTRWIAGALRGLCVTVLMGSLQAYKLAISPLLGSRCRFHPSCSVYAQGSIERFGPIVGSWLAAKRLLRCGPWHPGGVDPVPDHPGHDSEASSLTRLKSS